MKKQRNIEQQLEDTLALPPSVQDNKNADIQYQAVFYFFQTDIYKVKIYEMGSIANSRTRCIWLWCYS